MVFSLATLLVSSLNSDISATSVYAFTCTENYKRKRELHDIAVSRPTKAPLLHFLDNKISVDFSGTKLFKMQVPAEAIPGTYRIDCLPKAKHTFTFSKGGRIKTLIDTADLASIGSEDRGRGSFEIYGTLAVDGDSREFTKRFSQENLNPGSSKIALMDCSCGARLQLSLSRFSAYADRESAFNLRSVEITPAAVDNEDTQCIP